MHRLVTPRHNVPRFLPYFALVLKSCAFLYNFKNATLNYLVANHKIDFRKIQLTKVTSFYILCINVMHDAATMIKLF